MGWGWGVGKGCWCPPWELLEVRERPGWTLSPLRRLKGQGGSGSGVIRGLGWCQTWVQIFKDLCSLICSSLFPGDSSEKHTLRCLVSQQIESTVNGLLLAATKTCWKGHNKSNLILCLSLVLVLGEIGFSYVAHADFKLKGFSCLRDTTCPAWGIFLKMGKKWMFSLLHFLKKWILTLKFSQVWFYLRSLPGLLSVLWPFAFSLSGVLTTLSLQDTPFCWWIFYMTPRI